MPIPVDDTIWKAFIRVHDEFTTIEHFEDFASRWKGIDISAFRRAVREGSGEDRFLALLVLGSQDTPEDRDVLLPFLESPSSMERWASAHCLGNNKDERAYPVLQALLLDDLSIERRAQIYRGEWTDDRRYDLRWRCLHRSETVSLLTHWNDNRVIDTLQQAFYDLWRIEQQFGLFYGEANSYYVLAYALGLRGSLTLSKDMSLPSGFRKALLVHLAMGHAQAQGYAQPPVSWEKVSDELDNQKGLSRRIGRLLMELFALSKEDQKDALAHLYKHMHAHVYDSDKQRDSAPQHEDDEGDGDQVEEPTPSYPFVIDPEEENTWVTGEAFAPRTYQQYEEHTASVYSLSWSPDGTRIVSGSRDGTAHVWDVRTGRTLHVFRKHTGQVSCVAWSPCAESIASAGSDNTVYVWNAQTGEVLSVYHHHTALVYRALAWSPDGTRIATGAWDHTLHVWEAATGKRVLAYEGHQSVVSSLAWSPDGTRIVSASGYPDGIVKVWDPQTGADLLTFEGHCRDERQERPLDIDDDWAKEIARGPSSVQGLAWSPDGRLIVSAGLRDVCWVWDATTGEKLTFTHRTCGPVLWHPQGEYLLSVGHGVDLWHARSNRPVFQYNPYRLYHIETIALSPDGTLIVAAGESIKGAIRVWNVTLEKE